MMVVRRSCGTIIRPFSRSEIWSGIRLRIELVAGTTSDLLALDTIIGIGYVCGPWL